jgi:5'-nucleotidase
VDILKIEVPSDATPETPWRTVRVSRQRYYLPLPSGRRSLGEQKGIDYTRVINWDTLETDSDVRALAVERVVSVAPLTIDLTARVDLDELATDLQGHDQG